MENKKEIEKEIFLCLPCCWQVACSSDMWSWYVFQSFTLLSPWKHSYDSLPRTNLPFLVSFSTHQGTGKHLISIQFAWISFCGVLAVWNPQLGWKLEATMFRFIMLAVSSLTAPFFPCHWIMDTNPFALLLPPTLSLETGAFLFVYWTGDTSSPASDASVWRLG